MQPEVDRVMDVSRSNKRLQKRSMVGICFMSVVFDWLDPIGLSSMGWIHRAFPRDDKKLPETVDGSV